MAIFKENVKQCGFTIIPNIFIRGYGHLSYGAKMAFFNLLVYAWQGNVVYPSMRQQAEDLGVTEREIRYRLGELERAGLIIRELRTNQTSILWILDPSDDELLKYQKRYIKFLDDPVDSSEEVINRGGMNMPQGGNEHAPTGGNERAPKKETHLKKKGAGFQPVENLGKTETKSEAMSIELFKKAKICFEKSLGQCGVVRYGAKKNEVCEACPAFKKSEDKKRQESITDDKG